MIVATRLERSFAGSGACRSRGSTGRPYCLDNAHTIEAVEDELAVDQQLIVCTHYVERG